MKSIVECSTRWKIDWCIRSEAFKDLLFIVMIPATKVIDCAGTVLSKPCFYLEHFSCSSYMYVGKNLIQYLITVSKLSQDYIASCESFD